LIAAPLDNVYPVKFGGPGVIGYTHDGRDIIVAHGMTGWIHILDGTTFGVIDIMRSGDSNLDVAVNPVDDEFAVASGRRVIVWSLSNR